MSSDTNIAFLRLNDKSTYFINRSSKTISTGSIYNLVKGAEKIYFTKKDYDKVIEKNKK